MHAADHIEKQDQVIEYFSSIRFAFKSVQFYFVVAFARSMFALNMEKVSKIFIRLSRVIKISIQTPSY